MWQILCCCCLVAKSCPALCDLPRTVACQAPLTMGIPRQEYWSWLPFPYTFIIMSHWVGRLILFRREKQINKQANKILKLLLVWFWTLAWKWTSLSHFGLFAIPWTIQSMEFWSQNTGVGCHALLQGIFPIQGLNPGLPHCRRILYQLSHKGNPRILEWVAYLFSSGSSWPRNWTGVSHIAGGFFTNRAIWKYSLPSTNKSFALLSSFLEKWSIFTLPLLLSIIPTSTPWI